MDSSDGEGGAERVTTGLAELELLVSRISHRLCHTRRWEQPPQALDYIQAATAGLLAAASLRV
jgi:hypothetical protein